MTGRTRALVVMAATATGISMFVVMAIELLSWTTLAGGPRTGVGRSWEDHAMRLAAIVVLAVARGYFRKRLKEDK